MRWVVLAPFATSDDEGAWLGRYLSSGENSTVVVPRVGAPPNWHTRKLKVTGAFEWVRLTVQLLRGMRRRGDGGVITVFPQLAALVGLWKRLTRGTYPVVAYFFNTNEYTGIRRRLTRFAARGVDAFVVHTVVEGDAYSRWLGIDRGRFVFIHMQKPDMARQFPPDPSVAPFIYATGSGVRDYATFFEAARTVEAPFIVTPGHRVVQGLRWPDHVDVRVDVPSSVARTLFGQASLLVIPMGTSGAVAGTVTIVEALRFGLPMVVTERSGIADYLSDGDNCRLVAPGDAEAMSKVIDELWHDPTERARLAAAARRFGDLWTSDESAGWRLDALLSALEAGSPPEQLQSVVDAAGLAFASTHADTMPGTRSATAERGSPT